MIGDFDLETDVDLVRGGRLGGVGLADVLRGVPLDLLEGDVHGRVRVIGVLRGVEGESVPHGSRVVHGSAPVARIGSAAGRVAARLAVRRAAPAGAGAAALRIVVLVEVEGDDDADRDERDDHDGDNGPEPPLLGHRLVR